jgi:methionyl-tRNA formyltransferase
VFFGTPQFAVPSLDALLTSRHVVCAVLTQPDRPRGRGHRVQYAPVKAFALAHQLPVLQPDRLRAPEVHATLMDLAPDLGVVAAYGRLIPPALLALPPHGMINVHASLLPKYRGAAPVHRAIINGEVETGVTIMRVAETLDTGGMFGRARYPIGPDETSDAVEAALSEVGARLLLEVIDRIAAGSAREDPQDEHLATYAPRLSRDEGIIDWTRPAHAIHNQVRGLFPWPHACTWLEGERLIVLTTRLGPGSTASDVPPGTIVAVSGDALRVATGGHGEIEICALQLEGRRPMAVRDYLAGHSVATGSRFHRP